VERCTPILLVGAKISGLYDRDDTLLRKTPLDEAPKLFQAFARCNGTAPKPASSGQTIRYRLSRGGDRQANNALHTIARIRARHDEPTRTYLDRRISEGKAPREATRALKRHLSRSLYKRLITIPLT
jgi:hypothetical protein